MLKSGVHLFYFSFRLILQSRHGENALIEAVSYRRYDVARALIARRGTEVDVLDSRDRTPLVMAVQYGYAPLVSEKLKKRKRRREGLKNGTANGKRESQKL